MNQKSKAQILAEMAHVSVNEVDGDRNLGAMGQSGTAGTISIELEDGWTLFYNAPWGNESEYYGLIHVPSNDVLYLSEGDNAYAVIEEDGQY